MNVYELEKACEDAGMKLRKFGDDYYQIFGAGLHLVSVWPSKGEFSEHRLGEVPKFHTGTIDAVMTYAVILSRERAKAAADRKRAITADGSIDYVTDIIERLGLGFHAGNIVKCVVRHAQEGIGCDDLKEARWHLDRLIQLEDA